MAGPEHPSLPEFPEHPNEANGVVLPPDLADFLRASEPYVALFQATDRGTSLVTKLPRFEIESVRGPVPMHLNHVLYSHAAAPVIRSVLTVFDKPDQPLSLETFTNVADQDQRETFASLGWQEEFLLHFYDEQLDWQLSKRVTGFPQPEVLDLIDRAVDLARQMPRGRFDFDAAKAAVIQATTF